MKHAAKTVRAAPCRLAAVLVAAAALASPAWARTVFSGLDLAADGRLLFQAGGGGDGAPAQSALFLYDAAARRLRQLTAFPEKIDLLDGGRILQVRNPFGAVRLPISGGLPESVKGFPSFTEGAVVLGGRSEDIAASPDGKWLLCVEPVSAAFGRLVLVNLASGARSVIAESVETPGRTFPASWNPDSKVFVYEREDKLYFRAIDAAGATAIDERYRLIGPGRLASIRWGSASDFFYLSGSTVYRVRTSELFARALYADFLQIGQIYGKIPMEFNPNFDRFWIAPDTSAILLSKGGRNLFYYLLGQDDYSGDGAASFPYLRLPRSCSDLTVLWSWSGILTIFAAYPKDGVEAVQLFRLGPEEAGKGLGGFTQIATRHGPNAQLSPDGSRALVWGEGGAAVYEYQTWSVRQEFSKTPTLAAAWLSNEECLVADARRIERRGLTGGASLVCLSQADSFGYEDGGQRLIAAQDGVRYATDGKTGWQAAAGVLIKPTATATAAYRAYLETQASGPYANLPMLRNLQGVGTVPVLVNPTDAYDPLPTVEDFSYEGSADVFDAGRRLGRRELSLSFDLMDDAEGLPFVLDTLRRFGVKATFFLNGEFIRRHPTAAKEIVGAGQETGSLFFAPIDLSDARYRIDAEFIKRGLARNEDDFYNATGAELGLLWHPPYYASSPEIRQAAAAVGYRTIGRDIDPLDWVSQADAVRSPAAYRSASRLVDDIVAARKPGSIIPVRLGSNPGGRSDYLFNRLDVLLDALIRAGYDIVPVSTLIERAR